MSRVLPDTKAPGPERNKPSPGTRRTRASTEWHQVWSNGEQNSAWAGSARGVLLVFARANQYKPDTKRASRRILGVNPARRAEFCSPPDPKHSVKARLKEVSPATPAWAQTRAAAVEPVSRRLPARTQHVIDRSQEGSGSAVLTQAKVEGPGE